jgi:hypothetical protein
VENNWEDTVSSMGLRPKGQTLVKGSIYSLQVADWTAERD